MTIISKQPSKRNPGQFVYLISCDHDDCERRRVAVRAHDRNVPTVCEDHEDVNE